MAVGVWPWMENDTGQEAFRMFPFEGPQNGDSYDLSAEDVSFAEELVNNVCVDSVQNVPTRVSVKLLCWRNSLRMGETE